MTCPATDLSACLNAPLQAIVAAARAPAAVLAAVTSEQTAVACHGDPAPDAHTVFELGSITKTFTALLLAEMVTRGEVAYDDPITAYLPREARPRRATDAPITLAHLATHTAGLPRIPANLYPKALPAWWTNPYAHYHLDDLYRATARIRARHHPGARVSYSNFGVGLLGQLLANAAAADYRDLVLDRVCHPLGMTDTLTRSGPACAIGYRRGQPMRLP
ncbi:MAG: beta-lactamase family protein [Actinomycetota bacterium]|nr:beta-lactamase family protein [Actinomycetota bacterium]